MMQDYRKIILLFSLSAIVVLLPEGVWGTAQYAQQTGKSCEVCHIDPSGGGQLTKEGEAFRDDLRIKGLYRPLTQAQHVVRFLIGFFHTMTAITWFGAILYVHILLKPAYAARGLPRGELILGWGSIIIMAVTGTLLSVARVPSWQMLFSTRFGILLTMKITLFLLMVATAAFVTFVIGPKLKKRREVAVSEHKQDLTAEELAQFDGKEGRPAYIAYNGTIFDVSSSRLWKDGAHMRKHRAGSNLTDMLKTAPHGEDRITKMPIIGKLLQSDEQKRDDKPRLFYFLAYMNLVIVFLIVFVISLWRWW